MHRVPNTNHSTPTSVDGQIDAPPVTHGKDGKIVQDAEEESLLLLDKKKKKKKKPQLAETSVQLEARAASREVPENDRKEANAESVLARGGSDDVHGTLYSYTFLLGRLQDSLRRDHPSHPSLRSENRQQRSHVPPPQLAKVGGRRVSVTNFGAIVEALKRDAAHVQAFLLAELATTGSLDGSGESLTLASTLQAKHVEQLLRKYVHEYVICGQCKSLDTVLLKAEKARDSLLVCKCCNAERTLSTIKVGFQAVRRGERRACRAQ